MTLSHLLYGGLWLAGTLLALLATLGVIDVVRALYRRSRKTD